VKLPRPTLLVILCASQSRAEEARRAVAMILSTLGLQLHPDKTRTICLSQGADGFVFLGFAHRKVRSRNRPDRYYLQKWPSDRNMALIRTKIKAATGRNKVSRPISAVVADLNPVLRGWGNHFRWGNSARTFAAIDSYVHQRLAILASNKDAEAGTGRNVSPTPGSDPLAYTDSAGQFATTGPRMPDGERCRKAVCGRTACTV
jgi:RNA-directed DNA polymerase